jgi:hypothetical protein
MRLPGTNFATSYGCCAIPGAELSRYLITVAAMKRSLDLDR